MVVCVLIGCLINLPAQAAIKCWTNNEGIRECEYAQQGHQELSKSGMVVEEQDRAKTPEELEAEAKEKEMLAEEKRLQQERARADRVLLATFSSVEEIELVRDERIRAIQASITLAESQIESIQMDLDKRIQAAADAERSGNTPNEALLKDIASLERQVSTKNEYITGKKSELEQTKHDYMANIDRFKELKGL
jgi:chromosome segregation ATPase